MQSYLFTPYGEPWVTESPTIDVERKFTGHAYDKESKMYYMNARYMDPNVGVFITPDPSMSGLNHYNYCSANPVNYTDPTGLDVIDIDPNSGWHSSSGDNTISFTVFSFNFNTTNTRNESTIGYKNNTASSYNNNSSSMFNFDLPKSTDGLIAANYARQYEYNRMSNYNNQLGNFTSEDIMPGSSPTLGFNRKFSYQVDDGRNIYYEENHKSIDRVGGTNIISPGYTKVLSKSKYGVTLGLIGTDRTMSFYHLDNHDVSNLYVGQTFGPGDTVTTFPTLNNGDSTSPHVDYSLKIGNKYVNPDTYEPAPSGTSFYCRYVKEETVLKVAPSTYTVNRTIINEKFKYTQP